MEEPKHKQFKGTFKAPSGDRIATQLFVLLFMDDNSYIAYCPAINVYGYGATEQEAKDSFEVCLDEFFTYTLNKGTLFDELSLLGWKCKNKKNPKPPTLAHLISKNEEVADIWNHKNFTKFDRSIIIPAVC